MRVGVPDFGFRTGGDSGTFVFGDVVTFSCSPGYLRVGPTELICRGDGQFSGSAPSCESNLGSLNLVRYRALFLASFGEEAGVSQTAYEQADVNKNGLVSEARRKKRHPVLLQMQTSMSVPHVKIFIIETQTNTNPNAFPKLEQSLDRFAFCLQELL